MGQTEATSKRHSCLCSWWQSELVSASTTATSHTKGKEIKTKVLPTILHLPIKCDNWPAGGADHEGNQNVTARGVAFCSDCSPSARRRKTKGQNWDAALSPVNVQRLSRSILPRALWPWTQTSSHLSTVTYRWHGPGGAPNTASVRAGGAGVWVGGGDESRLLQKWEER